MVGSTTDPKPTDAGSTTTTTPPAPSTASTGATITPPVASALKPLTTTTGATGGGTSAAATDAAAQALLTARHKDQCVNTQVLSVRLVAKKGTRFVKAAFWINDKRVRTVAGAKLYVSKKTKKKVLRVQKFRNLPADKFVLKVLIRTSSGKRYRLRQVYYRCTPPHKAAKKIAVR